MYDIIAILIPIVLALCAVVVVRFLADAGVRKRVSETQTDADTVRSLLEAGREKREISRLTWGVMMAYVGMAMLLVGWLGLGANNPLTYGVLFIAAGAGMLTALWLGRRMS